MHKQLTFILLTSLYLSPIHPASFQEGMGKGTPAWQYVQTPEDISTLLFYETLYEKNQTSISLNSIPKIVHFIWLGPDAFPPASIANITKWMALHPDWTVKFWTDIDREPPCAGIQKSLVRNFTFSHLSTCYDKAENFGEKSLLLRYEILFQEGGLYLDHDVEPLSSFNPLHTTHDFYCTLEPLAASILSTSIYPSPHLIGAKPHHPILASTLTWLHNQWDLAEINYPGTAPACLINRVKHRSFLALKQAIEKRDDTHRDIVLPASTSYARHTHAGTWHTTKTEFETKMERTLTQMEKHSSRTTILLLSLAALNLITLSFFTFKHFRKS
jgi:mannosyltransferase OCH1-like enzyme